MVNPLNKKVMNTNLIRLHHFFYLTTYLYASVLNSLTLSFIINEPVTMQVPLI